MQATGGLRTASPKNRKRATCRNAKEQNNSRDREQLSTVAPSCPSSGYDFLKTEFEVITHDEPGWDIRHCLDEYNYSSLYKSAENYCRILNTQLKRKYNPEGNIWAEIIMLYSELSTKIPNNQTLDFFHQYPGLDFVIWEAHQVMEYHKVYAMPVFFIRKLNSKLKLLVGCFIKTLAVTQTIKFLSESYPIEMMYESLWEEAEDLGWNVSLLKSYKFGGKAKFINAIKQLPTLSAQELEILFSEYIPEKKEKKLVSLILQGIELLKENKDMCGDYDFEYGSGNDSGIYDTPTVSIKEMIILEYGEDWLERALFDHLECQANCGAEELNPCSYTMLSKATKPFISGDTYPKRFLEWTKEFSTFILSNYE